MTLKINSHDIINRYLPAEAVDFYLNEVQKADARFNLFSRGMTVADLRLLIAESLIPLEKKWIDSPQPVLDIGSGWGIPAVPLLLSGRGLDITLLERAEKKAGFLSLLLHRMISSEIFSTYRVVNLSLESYHPSETYRYIILRQVALDNRLWRHIKRLSLPEAQLIYFGSNLPASHLISADIQSYLIDNCPKRKIVKIEII